MTERELVLSGFQPRGDGSLMTSSQDDDDDDDDFLTKEDCLIEIVRGDNDDWYWDALIRFVELGGTQEEMRAAFDKSIALMERTLKGGRQ